jgi:hypothetical protein
MPYRKQQLQQGFLHPSARTVITYLRYPQKIQQFQTKQVSENRSQLQHFQLLIRLPQRICWH